MTFPKALLASSAGISAERETPDAPSIADAIARGPLVKATDAADGCPAAGRKPVQDVSKTFSKKDRLLKRPEFKRLSRQGRRLVGVLICIDWAKNSGRVRLGITASTHYGNSPERNRFKRLVREAFRLSRLQIPSGIDLNVIPRKLAKTASFAEIKAEFCRMVLNVE